jgi:hypothetical protein
VSTTKSTLPPLCEILPARLLPSRENFRASPSRLTDDRDQTDVSVHQPELAPAPTIGAAEHDFSGARIAKVPLGLADCRKGNETATRVAPAGNDFHLASKPSPAGRSASTTFRRESFWFAGTRLRCKRESLSRKN